MGTHRASFSTCGKEHTHMTFFCSPGSSQLVICRKSFDIPLAYSSDDCQVTSDKYVDWYMHSEKWVAAISCRKPSKSGSSLMELNLCLWFERQFFRFPNDLRTSIHFPFDFQELPTNPFKQLVLHSEPTSTGLCLAYNDSWQHLAQVDESD